jgi:hypothetical protein
VSHILLQKLPRFDKHATVYACKLHSRVGPVESRAGRKSPWNLDAKLGLSSGGGSPAIYPNWTASCFLPARSRTIYRSPKGRRLIKEKPALYGQQASAGLETDFLMLESQNEWVVHAKVKRLRDAPEPWKYEGAMDPKIKILCWPHPMHQGLRSHDHSLHRTGSNLRRRDTV